MAVTTAVLNPSFVCCEPRCCKDRLRPFPVFVLFCPVISCVPHNPAGARLSPFMFSCCRLGEKHERQVVPAVLFFPVIYRAHAGPVREGVSAIFMIQSNAYTAGLVLYHRESNR
jgi:hypothetical protein